MCAHCELNSPHNLTNYVRPIDVCTQCVYCVCTVRCVYTVYIHTLDAVYYLCYLRFSITQNMLHDNTSFHFAGSNEASDELKVRLV